MEIKNIFDDTDSGWRLFHRIYKNRCKDEIRLTNLIIEWFKTTEEKSLDKLSEVLEQYNAKKHRLSRMIYQRYAQGKYLTEPIHREYQISISKPKRFPFIIVSEPMSK